MKKTLLLLFTILFTLNSFSQSNAQELTDKQKESLRKKHNNGLVFSSSKKKSTTQLKTSNATEQNPDEVTSVKVKYYYGKEDSLYKDFEYTKPD